MALLEINDTDVVYYLRDINKGMVNAWSEIFSDYPENIKVSEGDIFYGAPAADAIVSPANSFGFMDGGIDLAYTKHFGSQMQQRLQKVIQHDYDGELLVGQAIIIPSYGKEGRDEAQDWSMYNEGVAIKYLISSPTMRVPLTVSDTVNAYLAFRAVLLAVQKHNKTEGVAPIKTVLVPGLGTAVGKMPKLRCAWQMLQAYETFIKRTYPKRIKPDCLEYMWKDHHDMCEFGDK